MNILHPTRTLPALLPRYVERFRCIGSQCEDTCCSGWTVTIDKKTFNAYRQIQHPALSADIGRSMTRRRSQASNSAYARIKLDTETNQCPMSREGLCSIQKNLNESYLSNTCFSYPRYSRNFGGQYEQALTLSCPEAARLALLAPDAFDFIEGSVTVRTESVTAVSPAHGIPVELMNEIRIFCLKLIRTEGLELWQKLGVLGFFCEQLTELLQSGKHAQLASLLENSVAMIENGFVGDALADMHPNHASQAVVFATFWSGAGLAMNQSVQKSAVQKEVTAAIVRGFGADTESGEVTDEQLVDAYVKGLERLPEALQAAPHLLEHFLLNELFRELFPFKHSTPYDDFLQLIARFGLLRLMLAAQCNTEGALPDASALVATVQVFYRRFQHDARFARMNQMLRKSGFGTLDKVYGFLRT